MNEVKTCDENRYNDLFEPSIIKLNDLYAGMEELEVHDFPHLLLHGFHSETPRMVFESSELAKKYDSWKIVDSISDRGVFIEKKGYLEVNGMSKEFTVSLLRERMSGVRKRKNQSWNLVVIQFVDWIGSIQQNGLRNLMETYSHKWRFILIGQNISKLIDPLKSRCVVLKCPCPTHEKLEAWIDKYAKLIGKDVSESTRQSIVDYCEGSVELCEAIIKNLNFYGSSQSNFPQMLWKQCIIDLAKLITEKHSIQTIKHVRTKLYTLLKNGIQPNRIIKEICDTLLKRSFDSEVHHAVIHYSSKYEQRLSYRCSRHPIYHLEAFCVKLMIIFQHMFEQYMDF